MQMKMKVVLFTSFFVGMSLVAGSNEEPLKTEEENLQNVNDEIITLEKQLEESRIKTASMFINNQELRKNLLVRMQEKMNKLSLEIKMQKGLVQKLSKSTSSFDVLRAAQTEKEIEDLEKQKSGFRMEIETLEKTINDANVTM